MLLFSVNLLGHIPLVDLRGVAYSGESDRGFIAHQAKQKMWDVAKVL